VGPEFLIALVAVFVSGGAVGTAGTLLTQWLLRRFDSSAPRDGADPRELDVLRSEVAEVGRQLRNLDARLDFTERLLDGALTPPHPRVAGPEPTSGEPRADDLRIT
jgi:hypothetical protein